MPEAKKNISSRKPLKKAVIVTKTKTTAKVSPFASKVEKVNKMLEKTKWLDS